MDQLRTVTSTYDPADACVRAASTYPYLSAADVTQRKRLCDWGISLGPTTNGVITGACLWSHYDRRHLIMCILMSTFMCHDNVNYVITNRHRQKDHLLHFKFISNSFRWSAISGYVSWLRASWWGAANPKLWKFVWYKIDYYRSGHWRTCIWPCLTMRNTCPLLSLHLIILEYVSDQFKTEVVYHDNAAKFTGFSWKIHIFAYWKCARNDSQSYRTTAHTLSIISAIYFLLRMHFVDFSRNCFGSFLA